MDGGFTDLRTYDVRLEGIDPAPIRDAWAISLEDASETPLTLALDTDGTLVILRVRVGEMPNLIRLEVDG
jgi:hypothetical protein